MRLPCAREKAGLERCWCVCSALVFVIRTLVMAHDENAMASDAYSFLTLCRNRNGWSSNPYSA